MRSNRVTDRLFSLLKDLVSERPVSVKAALPSLDELLGSDAGSEMTPSEIETTKNHLNLLKIVYLLGGSKSITSEEAGGCLSQVEEWLNYMSQNLALNDNKVSPVMSNTAVFLGSGSLSAPSWRFFHENLLTVETLRAVSQIATIALKKGNKSAKLPKDRVEKLAALARQVSDSVRANVRGLKSSESGMLGALVDLVLGGITEEGEELRNTLENILDTSGLELFCGALMESWEQGLDGMLSVTL